MLIKTTIAMLTALLLSLSGCLLPATQPCKDVPPGEPGSCHEDDGTGAGLTADSGEFADDLMMPMECGDLTFEGRCEGDLLTWCEDGRVQALDCTRFESRACGWDEAAGIHDCGN